MSPLSLVEFILPAKTTFNLKAVDIKMKEKIKVYCCSFFPMVLTLYVLDESVQEIYPGDVVTVILDGKCM